MRLACSDWWVTLGGKIWTVLVFVDETKQTMKKKESLKQSKINLPFPIAEGGGNTGACWWENACSPLGWIEDTEPPGWVDCECECECDWACVCGWAEEEVGEDDDPAAAGGTGKDPEGSFCPISGFCCGFHDDIFQ